MLRKKGIGVSRSCQFVGNSALRFTHSPKYVATQATGIPFSTLQPSSTDRDVL